MVTVFTNADFISLDEDNSTYSTMVVDGREIAYVGYGIPLCYDDKKVVDLNGKCVIPLCNDKLCLAKYDSDCRVLKAGERADFAVVDKNILRESDNIQVVEVYFHGRLKK